MNSRNIFDHIPFGIKGSQPINFEPQSKLPSPVLVNVKPEAGHPRGKHVFDQSSEEEIDLQYIIDNKPKASIVREFMRMNLSCIKSEGEQLFEMDPQ